MIVSELAGLVKVVRDGHDEWDERRSRWNRFTEDTLVTAVAVPMGVPDVVKIIDWARDRRVANLSVRAGGHGYFSASEVVVDMRDGFDYATLDEATGVVTVGMGQTLAALDSRTHPWHVPMGVVSHTGTGPSLSHCTLIIVRAALGVSSAPLTPEWYKSPLLSLSATLPAKSHQAPVLPVFDPMSCV